MTHSENYGINIIGGKELEGGYVALGHQSNYQIQFQNRTTEHASIQLWIDGKKIAQLIQSPHSVDELERPQFENKKFVFLKTDSSEAQSVGIDKMSKEHRGLIKVCMAPVYKKTIEFESDARIITRSVGSGGTALGETSNQHLPTTKYKWVRDSIKMEVFFIRLIHDSTLDNLKGYSSLQGINAFPAPID